MFVKWMLWALAASVAVGAGTAVVGHLARAPSARSGTALARDAAAPVVAGADARPAPVRERRTPVETAARPAPSGGDAGPDPAASGASAVGAERRSTEAAIAASRRISQPESVQPDPASSRAPGVLRAVAAVSLCKDEGRECRSSADCCAGLACAGGVAGYGVSGRCEGVR